MKKIGKMFGYLKTMRYLCNAFEKQICSSASCPDGGIGRRAGLKHQWIHFHAGSIPALGYE